MCALTQGKMRRPYFSIYSPLLPELLIVVIGEPHAPIRSALQIPAIAGAKGSHNAAPVTHPRA